MFSSIVAHLTEIIPSLANVLAPIFGEDLDTDQDTSVLTETAPAAVAQGQDRRKFFVGKWDCTGIKIVEGKELPYNGHMDNSWTLSKTWLLIDFKESQPAEGKAFAEHQYWSFVQENGIHTRPMMTSTNGFAIVHSTGWVGDAIAWSGTYDLGSARLDLTETITILGPNKFRMLGEIFLKGKSVGLYDVTGTRKHKGHHYEEVIAI